MFHLYAERLHRTEPALCHEELASVAVTQEAATSSALSCLPSCLRQVEIVDAAPTLSFSKVSVLKGATVSPGHARPPRFAPKITFQRGAAGWSLFSSCGKRLALTYQTNTIHLSSQSVASKDWTNCQLPYRNFIQARRELLARQPIASDLRRNAVPSAWLLPPSMAVNSTLAWKQTVYQSVMK
jgi:hypothetical protein